MLCSRLLEVVAPFFFYSCGDHRDRHSFPTHALPIFFAANALAIFLDDSGEPERARELHEETLQRRRRLFPDDPDWLYSANRLAGVLRELGDIARAHDLFEDTYEKCRRILGPDNIETLNVAGRG